MKKAIPGWDDNRITPSCGNVFIDLGFDEAEAEILLMRANLMLSLERHIATQGWTQAEAAKRMGITQPRVSKLKKGAWQEFSLDMLLTLAARVGLHPELRLAA
jgi:predicted XRE-type DNA-binding protein